VCTEHLNMGFTEGYEGFKVPIYPIPVILKTVFAVLGVVVPTAYPLTVDIAYAIVTDVQPAKSLSVDVTYSAVTDVQPAKGLSVDVTYSTSTDVQPAQSLSVDVTYTYSVSVS